MEIRTRGILSRYNKKEFQFQEFQKFIKIQKSSIQFIKMIIVRSPLRIYQWYGTDIPSYFKEKKVFLYSAINKYVYNHNSTFEQGIYSNIQELKNKSNQFY